MSSYKSRYRAEIDGLRAFAVLSVVIFHAFPFGLKGGFVGVDIFFVISGFLITGHIFEKLDKGKFSFTDFFRRRIIRLFPALITVMVFSLILGWFILFADEYSQLGKHVASGAGFIINFILEDESGYFDNSVKTKPMLHLWSLSIEEQFYIIWPLVLWLAWRRQHNLFVITIIVALISFSLNLSYIESNSSTKAFFWPVTRFWELLSGSILAWFFLYKRNSLIAFRVWSDKLLNRLVPVKFTSLGNSISLSFISLVGILMLFFSVVKINEGMKWPSEWALIPILGTLLIIAAGSKAWFNRILFMNPIAVWFGLISYPLYLWHWPILSFMYITDGEMPHRDARIIAILISIFLAWLTYKFIEVPFRFGRFKKRGNVLLIALTLFLIGTIGYFISVTDFSESLRSENRVLKRQSSDNAINNSLKWYKGKGDWLFLGNDYDNTVAKCRLAITPVENDIESVIDQFSILAQVASKSNTQVALLIGPNKSSVYTEFLPEQLVPSKKRYSTFFTDKLSTIPNLIVQDPTNLLRASKLSEGIVYYRTDTHWNYKGAYISYIALLKQLGLNLPKVHFSLGSSHKGDLIGISKLNEFPVHLDDNWNFEIIDKSKIVKDNFSNQPKDSFGWRGLITNYSPLNEMTVWVVGDSFTSALIPYLNATFKEVRYIGHWTKYMNLLPAELEHAAQKPNLVLVVRVERSF